MMTAQQEAHLIDIQGRFVKQSDRKYRKGQEEHGGDLLDLDIEILLDAAIDESIDQFVYLTTMKQKMEAIAKIRLANLP